jgi:hypothetical protein
MKWVYEIQPVTVGLAKFEVRKIRRAEGFWESIGMLPWPPEHMGFFDSIEAARTAIAHYQIPKEEYPLRSAPNGS